MENKQEELKSAEEILEKWYQIYRDTPLFSRFDADIKAMEEYADQFKKQLKEKEIENEKLKNQLRLIDEFFSTMFHPNNINNPNARF